MNYVKENLGFSTNKINRKITFKARLNHNASSWNRSSDTTPRFWLEAVSLISVERVGFTSQSLKMENSPYQKEGHRVYDNKMEVKLSDSEAEYLFGNLKENFPYGYKANDRASETKYIVDLMNNDAFQAHYANYWNDNSDKIIPTGPPDHNTYPCIEFETSEIFSTKHNSGNVPAVEGGSVNIEQDTGYKGVTFYETSWNELLCDPKVMDVSVPTGNFIESIQDYAFAITNEEYRGKHMQVDSVNETEYVVRFVEPWPTGTNGLASGIAFKLSETDDGTHHYGGAGVEYSSAYAGAFDHEEITYVVTVASNGTQDVFYLDGVEAPALNFKRGSKYIFDQTDSSNSGHPLYIGNSSLGGDAGDSKNCHVQETADDIMTFSVPMDAPNSLWYQCENHQNMGAGISIADPTFEYPAPGAEYEDFVPGRALRLKFPSSTDETGTYYYYNNNIVEAGGGVYTRDCSSKCPGAVPDKLGVDEGYMIMQQ
jgi:hypothetical protein